MVPETPETPERFEILEHTADIGIRARGRDLVELFRNAAAGTLAIVADTKALKPSEALPVGVEVSAAACVPDDLLVVWLEELLYLSETRRLLFQRVEVEVVGEREVAGKVFGAPLEQNLSALRREIKAVTYHQLKVEKAPGGDWTCQVIFDV